MLSALTAGASSELATVPPEEAAGPSDWLQAKSYLRGVLGTDLSKDKLHRIGPLASAVEKNGDILSTAPLIGLSPQLYAGTEAGTAYIRVRLNDDQVVRILISGDNRPLADESPMLEWS